MEPIEILLVITHTLITIACNLQTYLLQRAEIFEIFSPNHGSKLGDIIWVSQPGSNITTHTSYRVIIGTTTDLIKCRRDNDTSGVEQYLYAIIPVVNVFLLLTNAKALRRKKLPLWKKERK